MRQITHGIYLVVIVLLVVSRLLFGIKKTEHNDPVLIHTSQETNPLPVETKPLKIDIDTPQKKEFFTSYKTFPSLRTITTSPVINPSSKYAPLTLEGKETINAIRNYHTPTILFKEEQNDEGLCAGYIYDLSRLLRGDLIVNTIGLHHPKTHTVCDARELPYCYWYRGGTILYDVGEKIGKKLKKDPLSYVKNITQEELIRLFSAAFSSEATLGDLTFLYNHSSYLHMIGSYGNYNSHIGKNMGLSQFKVIVQYPETPHISNELLLRNALGCSHDIRTLLLPVRSRYEFWINGNRAIYTIEGELYREEKGKRATYQLQTLDQITYTDIAVAHFRKGERIDSYFQLSCKGDFSPIAVIEINKKFIEKM